MTTYHIVLSLSNQYMVPLYVGGSVSCANRMIEAARFFKINAKLYSVRLNLN
jgi:hypothetical protein